jgi:acyl-CoA reductase-like NAD-dependent aldehyde dehydrogenase
MRSLGETPGPGARPSASTPAEIDRAVERLSDGAHDLVRTPAAEKARLLGEIMRRLHELAPRLSEAGSSAKGFAPGEELSGEELLAGPVTTLHYLRLLSQSLSEIAKYGLPQLPSDAVREHPSGSAVTVLPITTLDKLRFTGISAEAWLDLPPSRVSDARAGFYRRGKKEATVAVVLGAGNIPAIPPMDALHQIFVDGRSCLLKMSPVNDYLGPLYELCFAPLVQRGWLAFAYGGADVGAYCTGHRGVGAVHITGSGETHDRIVWGDEPERSERKRRGEPLLDKAITSELGNITPVIVPPGDYTERELEHVARSVAGMLSHNASFNCISAKVLVLPATSFGRDVLAGVRRVLGKTQTRRAYYPGARARYDELAHGAGELEEIGRSDDEHLPWAIVSGLDASADPALFRREPFCSILSVVMLPEAEPSAFLAAATRFANEKLWGTLSAVLVAPHSMLADASPRFAVERAIEDLNYGAVSLNAWSGLAFGMGELPWGAAPGATLADAKSGIGWAHNALMLESVRKVVLRAPLAAFPTPFWYPGHRSLKKFARSFLDYELEPSALKLAKLVAAAVPG